MTALVALPFLALAVVLAVLMRSGGRSTGRGGGSFQYVRCGNCGQVLGLNGEADILRGTGSDHRCGS